MTFLKNNNQETKANQLALLKGGFIIATPLITDALFSRQIIFITESEAETTYGFFIDFNLKSSDVIVSCKSLLKGTIFESYELYLGGPVATETIFIIHSNEMSSKSTFQINNFVSVTPLDEAIINFKVQPEFSKIVVGYCEWHAGQLAREIKLGYWLSKGYDNDLFFNKKANKWRNCLNEFNINPMTFDSTIGIS